MTLSFFMSNRIPRLNLDEPVTPSSAPNYLYSAPSCSIFFRPGSKSHSLVFAALARRNHKAFQHVPSLHRATKPALPGFSQAKKQFTLALIARPRPN